MEKNSLHIAIFPSPWISILIAAVEFAKRVVVLHPDFNITIIIPSLGNPSNYIMKAIPDIESLPAKINIKIVPQPSNEQCLPEDEGALLQMQRAVTQSLPFLHKILESLSSRTRLVALVVDPFANSALDVAKELSISPYIIFPSNATSLSLFFHLINLDKKVSCEFRDLPEPIEIPGSIRIHGQDLPTPVQERSSQLYKSFLRLSSRLRLAKGIIVNSFIDMEGEAIQALQGEEDCPPIYPIGPLTRSNSTNQSDGSEYLRWLDNQPCKSVIYISFGSGGNLSHKQFTELALGLEMSGVKFLWVVRAPISESESANPAHIGAETEDPIQFLPSGFLDRIKGQGLVVPYWASQIEVLSHKSIGGFLCHCGWNSILESLVHGVPIIAWPIFAEQKMNAVMLTDYLKVAVRPEVDKSGIVERDEVAKVIKILMGGDESQRLDRRMKGLKDVAAISWSENGSSTGMLSELVSKWKEGVLE